MPFVVVDWDPNSKEKLVRELIVILDVFVIACCPIAVGCMGLMGDVVGGTSSLIPFGSGSSERMGVVGGDGSWDISGSSFEVVGFGSLSIASRAEARSTSLPLSGTDGLISSTLTE